MKKFPPCSICGRESWIKLQSDYACQHCWNIAKQVAEKNNANLVRVLRAMLELRTENQTPAPTHNLNEE